LTDTEHLEKRRRKTSVRENMFPISRLISIHSLRQLAASQTDEITIHQ